MSTSAIANIKSKVDLAKAIFSSEPNYMVLFVTARCNARCPMCFYWKEIESSSAKSELTLDEYKSISHSLNKLHYLSIGGGEPFLRKDLPQVVEAFYKNSQTRIVTVATNGTFPDRVQNYTEYLARNCPGLQMRIQVSIDNLYDKHDRNRGVNGIFDKMIQTCGVIGKQKQAGISVMFSIGTVLTPSNRGDLKDLRAYLDERIDYDDLSLIYPRGNAKDPAMKEISMEEYQKTKKIFESIQTSSGTFARLYQTIDREAKKGIECFLKDGESGYPWTCVAGKRMITLTETGILTPCEMLHQLKPDMDSSIGNVRDFNYDIAKMLMSDKAQKLRRFIENTHCSCSYECAALCNVVFQKKSWPKLLKQVLKK